MKGSKMDNSGTLTIEYKGYTISAHIDATISMEYDDDLGDFDIIPLYRLSRHEGVMEYSESILYRAYNQITLDSFDSDYDAETLKDFIKQLDEYLKAKERNDRNN